MQLVGTIISWISRLVLLPLGLQAWLIMKNIGDIPFTDMSWLYFSAYCFALLAIICYLLLTTEKYAAEEPSSASSSIPYYVEVGVGVCIFLTLLFPLVVVSHWLFCSKRSWHSALLFPGYILLLTAVWYVGTHMGEKGNVFSIFGMKSIVGAAAIFHIYPCWLAANVWGILSSLLMLLKLIVSYLKLLDSDFRNKTFVYCWLTLGIASLMVMSFTRMMLNKLGINSDSKSYYQSAMSYVGAGKYVGDVEYSCYSTTDFYGVKIRA